MRRLRITEAHDYDLVGTLLEPTESAPVYAPSPLIASLEFHDRRASRARQSEPIRKMKCPICKKEVTLGDPDLPFCSERCRMIDLGNWASEKYVISDAGAPQDCQTRRTRTTEDAE